MVHIYSNTLTYIISLNYDYEDFKKNPSLYYPKWQTSYYATENKYEHPIVDDDNVIREMTREEKILQLGMEELLEDGEYIEAGEIIVVEYDESLGYLKKTWDKVEHIYYEGATPDEITEHMGILVTKLLYDVMKIGCEVTIHEEKHQQSLEKSKREALDEQIGGIKLAEELGKPITTIMWPFKDDGSDTITMATNEFKQMVFECHTYGQNCYIAAELLKAKRKVNSTIEDFYTELENVESISLKNL